jgi:hypothetical protein
VICLLSNQRVIHRVVVVRRKNDSMTRRRWMVDQNDFDIDPIPQGPARRVRSAPKANMRPNFFRRARNEKLGQQITVSIIAGISVTAIFGGFKVVAARGHKMVATPPWQDREPVAVTYGAFSPDGARFLLEEHGQNDDGNFYSSLRSINVGKNKTIGDPIYATGKDLLPADCPPLAWPDSTTQSSFRQTPTHLTT